MSNMVDSKTVSELLKTDRIGLHHIRKAGLLPFSQIGRQVLYDKAKVEKVIKFVDKLNNEK